MNTLYVVARTLLLDALETLNEQRAAVVLVGAQAIYLHTGDADIAVPAFTTDGDLVIEPSRVRDQPRLAEARRFFDWFCARDLDVSGQHLGLPAFAFFAIVLPHGARYSRR